MESKTKTRKRINRFINFRNRTHYLKWNLDGEWSVRRYFTFDNKKECEGKWYLKSHQRKIYIELSSAEAIDFIRHKAKVKDPVEVYGIREGSKKYRRMVLGNTFESYIDRNDRRI